MAVVPSSDAVSAIHLATLHSASVGVYLSITIMFYTQMDMCVRHEYHVCIGVCGSVEMANI